MADLRDLACGKLRALLLTELAGDPSVLVGVEVSDEFSARLLCSGTRIDSFEVYISVRLVEAGVLTVVYRLDCHATGAARVVFFTRPPDLLRYIKRYLVEEHITRVDLASGDESE